MKERYKQMWVSEEAHKAAKIQAAAEGLKLSQYVNKKLIGDSKEAFDLKPIKKRGYYGFLK